MAACTWSSGMLGRWKVRRGPDASDIPFCVDHCPFVWITAAPPCICLPVLGVALMPPPSLSRLQT